jgi:hypothetical protein
MKAPYLGFVAFFLIWLWKPIAHTTSVLLHLIEDPVLYVTLCLSIGAVGFMLVWRGLKLEELPATWHGFMGGALIWIGWFEFTFEHFAKVIGVDELRYADGRYGLPPAFVFMQATAFIVLALVLFFAANKDTGCRFFQWLHRNLGLRPGSSTPGYQRQYARIAALELVMVNWFCYIVILTLMDPRFSGVNHPIMYTGGLVIAALSFYLIVFKLKEQRTMAPALRYSIGAVGIFWLLCEMTAMWGWYPEIWLKPFQYPIYCALQFMVFGAGIAFTIRGIPFVKRAAI